MRITDIVIRPEEFAVFTRHDNPHHTDKNYRFIITCYYAKREGYYVLPFDNANDRDEVFNELIETS